MNLPEHVEQSIRARQLFRRRARIVVAVSGGLDSMVLLHLLQQLAPAFGWKLFVAHFNHQLRGRASDADERFVKQTAAALRLPFRAGRGTVKTFAKRHGLSVEMAARELRHEFLARTAVRLHCPVVALAHHADDQVELFFLRLLRGAGGEGLAGMKWRSPSPANQTLELVRPLLDVSKADLATFADANGIRFREDASNASADILRNRVRHELLPLLRNRFQPALDRTILRLMDIVGADAEVASDAARAGLRLNTGSRLHRLSDWPVGLQRRVIQLQLQKHKIEASFDLIESLRGMPDQPVTVRPGLRVACDAAGRILKVAATSDKFRRQRAVIRLAGAAGEFTFAGAAINWERLKATGVGLPVTVAGQELFDAAKVGAKIVVRHWQPGDRFQPIGMSTAVKLQDWFTNQKVPRARRRQLIVATTAAGEIFWVEDQRIGERFKLTAATPRRLNWRWRRL